MKRNVLYIEDNEKIGSFLKKNWNSGDFQFSGCFLVKELKKK